MVAEPMTQTPFPVLNSLAQITRLVNTYRSRGERHLHVDIETTGLDPRAGRLITLQMQQRGYPAVVLDLRHLDLHAVSALLKPLASPRFCWVGHNLKFDLGWLLVHLDLCPPRVFDTMLAEQVLRGVGREDARAQGVDLSLKGLTKSYLGLSLSKEERNWFIDLDTRPLDWEAPLPREQVHYALSDVEHLGGISTAQREALTEAGLVAVARLEMRTLPALVRVEANGVLVDTVGWRAVIAEEEAQARVIEEEALLRFGPPILTARAEVWSRKAQAWRHWEDMRLAEEARLRGDYDSEHPAQKWGEYKLAGMQDWRKRHPNPGRPRPDDSPPNLGSPKQLLDAFRLLRIPAKSTDSGVLKPLAGQYEEIDLLLRYRRSQKIVDAFGESLLKFVGPDGRIHPEYQQIGASTGRMSCTRPNWQQIPSKGVGKKLRACVVAAPGCKLLIADFSNIELRILADLSGDATMLRLFAEGADLHSETARMMFGLPAHVDPAAALVAGSVKTTRDAAKTINFGLVYGMGVNKLAGELKITKEAAADLMEKYFNLYRGVRPYLERMRNQARTEAYSETAAGRKRFYRVPREPILPFADRKNPTKWAEYKEAAQEWKKTIARIERQGGNTPIQGTSADITKLALALFTEATLDTDARVIAVVHDELVVECPTGYAGEVAELLAGCMDQAQKTYLKRVETPRPKVNISDHWEK